MQRQAATEQSDASAQPPVLGECDKGTAFLLKRGILFYVGHVSSLFAVDGCNNALAGNLSQQLLFFTAQGKGNRALLPGVVGRFLLNSVML